MQASDRIRLLLGDCLEELQKVPDGSIDFICTDLPYGCTNAKSEAGKWDCQIPLEPLWEQFLRVTKDNAAIVLFAQGLFTAKLILSQPHFFKYSLVWCKGNRVTGFLNANRMPLRNHEDICVFYRKQPTYNPQMERRPDGDVIHSRGTALKDTKLGCYGKHKEVQSNQIPERFPKSVITFSPPHKGFNHPTEKPVDLCRWLIRTYTNAGETVLDATMGSGTTGVAAVLEGRRFVGVEREKKYFDVAEGRIKQTLETPRQEELFS